MVFINVILQNILALERVTLPYFHFPIVHRRASTSNIGVAINFSLYSHHENLFSADLIYSFLIYCNEVNKKNDMFQKISFLVFFFAMKSLTD